MKLEDRVKILENQYKILKTSVLDLTEVHNNLEFKVENLKKRIIEKL